MKNSIVTKTGDDGNTFLFGKGIRVSKSHIRVQTYGMVDELNSLIGVVISNSSIKEIDVILKEIQHQLFEIGSDLAIPSEIYNEKFTENKKELFNEFLITLEAKIDFYEEKLPELTSFILPGGSIESSNLHLGRTVCRRVERSIVELMKYEKLNSIILQYFNRLSDLFFILARFANFSQNVKDIPWQSRHNN